MSGAKIKQSDQIWKERKGKGRGTLREYNYKSVWRGRWYFFSLFRESTVSAFQTRRWFFLIPDPLSGAVRDSCSIALGKVRASMREREKGVGENRQRGEKFLLGFTAPLRTFRIRPRKWKHKRNGEKINGRCGKQKRPRKTGEVENIS